MANLATLGAIVLAFVIAALVIRVARTAIHRLLGRLHIVNAENRAVVQARARQLTGALMLLAYGVAALASASLVLSQVGIAAPQIDVRAIGAWLTTHGINLIVIVAGAWIVMRAANLAIEHLQFKIGREHGESDLEWQRRASTLRGILTSVVTVSVAFISILMVLRELSIDVVPILTGAGIAGLAIGFGAQNLVRDVISGFFLILEDQVRIGDLARINGITGSVEQINLRTIALRDGEGAVHIFPNGTITALANLSKQFSYALVDVRVGYAEPIDRAIATVRDAGAAMERDAVWGPLLLGPLEVLGVEAMDRAAATLRVRFKVQPLQQTKVANELRRRLAGTSLFQKGS
jgi:moderate conductance mechanosensitive channel